MDNNPFFNIEKKLKEIEDLLKSMTPQQNFEVELTSLNKMMSIAQLIEYLPEKPAKQTVYGWVNDRKIPYEKHGKRLFFVKSEIDEWLDNGRKMSHLKREED